MRFKIDENMPIEVVGLLNQAGHDAESVLDEQLGGTDDERLAARCLIENRVIVTLDLDFANTRAYPPEQFAGFIVLRVGDQRKRHVTSVFARSASAGYGVAGATLVDPRRTCRAHSSWRPHGSRR